MNPKTWEELHAMYEEVGDFVLVSGIEGGLARAREKDERNDKGLLIKRGKWLHIFCDGTPAYIERYDYVWPFGDHDLARVKNMDGKFFHIKPNGEAAYEERFDWIAPRFEGDLVAVRIGTEEFYIDKDGQRSEKTK